MLNFPVSGHSLPPAFVRALGLILAALSPQPLAAVVGTSVQAFTLGNSFVLSEQLSVGAESKPACQVSSSVNCLNGESGAVDVDFGHSSYWNGITSIAVRNPGTGLFESKDRSLFSLSSNSGRAAHHCGVSPHS